MQVKNAGQKWRSKKRVKNEGQKSSLNKLVKFSLYMVGPEDTENWWKRGKTGDQDLPRFCDEHTGVVHSYFEWIIGLFRRRAPGRDLLRQGSYVLPLNHPLPTAIFCSTAGTYEDSPLTSNSTINLQVELSLNLQELSEIGTIKKRVPGFLVYSLGVCIILFWPLT